MKSFKNKVAAVTGAGSGIGQAIAIALAKQGCHLALSDISEAGLAKTVELLAPYSVKVTTQKVDVAKRDEVATWAKAVVDGHGQVNLIFNNAGVAIGSTAEGVSYEDLEWLIGINFWGVVYGTKEFLPYLKQSGDGHIINISSMFGLTAQPPPNLGVNPSLTITALAERAMSYIPAKHTLNQQPDYPITEETIEITKASA